MPRCQDETNEKTTALVGVITNKTRIDKQIHEHSPCWCYHQQDSMQKQDATMSR
jgi:hypothetical protein